MNARTAMAACASLLLLAACSDREPVSPVAPHFARGSETPPVLSPDLVALGKAIYFDEGLSANHNQSCASCHAPAWGFAGPRSDINAAGAVYPGSFVDRFGARRPPAASYATPSPVLHWDGGLFVGGNFWDGRATGERLGNPAAEQAQGPFLNPVEQALASAEDVVTHVCANHLALFPARLAGLCSEGTVQQIYDVVGLAVASYEDSPEVNPFSSKYDAYFAGQAKLTQEERKGLALFRGKGKCSKCHLLGSGNAKEAALFTDFTFDNLGIPANPENPVYGVDPGFVDYGLGGFLAGSGRSEWAALAGDFLGMHKVATLRNVDRRPNPGDIKAFGHNGYFKSLWEIVHFYNTRDVLEACPGPYTSQRAVAEACWPDAEVMANVNTAELGDLGLSFKDEMAIVAFLKTLSDGFVH